MIDLLEKEYHEESEKIDTKTVDSVAQAVYQNYERFKLLKLAQRDKYETRLDELNRKEKEELTDFEKYNRTHIETLKRR
jgi:hypothetical protein